SSITWCCRTSRNPTEAHPTRQSGSIPKVLPLTSLPKGQYDETTRGRIIGRPATNLAQEGMPKIVVVDDDPDVLDTIAAILKRAGHCVHKATGGQAALEFFDQYDKVDLLLTDVLMPGLNGFNLARLAKARQPAVKVLYLS